MNYKNTGLVKDCYQFLSCYSTLEKRILLAMITHNILAIPLYAYTHSLTFVTSSWVLLGQFVFVLISAIITVGKNF